MKILCVEDNQEILTFVSTILKKESHAVDTCDNGQDAFDKACSNKYDLIILDYNLPCKNGYEICRDLRSININSYIMFLTIKSDLKDNHPVEVCFQALYMKLLLRLQKKDVNAESEQAFDSMRILLAYLTKGYHEMKAGNMEMFEKN
jgi:CheY-like chemotaxis protein